MDNEFVYFARQYGKSGLKIKVGYTKWVASRIKNISSETGRQTTLITAVPGSLMDEQALHEILANYRLHGEWYRHGRLPHRLIKYCLTHHKLPDCVVRAGKTMSELRQAKREWRIRKSEASRFFEEIDNFGLRHDEDPFALGQPLLDMKDASWLDKMMVEFSASSDAPPNRKNRND